MNLDLFVYNSEYLPDNTFDKRQKDKLRDKIERHKDCTSQQRAAKFEDIIIDILAPASFESYLKEYQQGIFE